MTFNGVIVPVRHVYAAVRPGFFDKNADDIHVLLSDRPLADAVRDDTFALMALARDEGAHIIAVVIDADGDPISGSLYVPEVNAMISASGMHVFTREALERARIAGRLAVPDPRTFMGLTWAYDVRFTAPIPRPPSADELAAALASPPAQAAMRHVAALKANDRAAFLATMTDAAAAPYRGADGAAAFAAFRADMPDDARVVGLVPQTDGSVLVNVEGHEQGIVVAYELRLVREAGGWKVGQ